MVIDFFQWLNLIGLIFSNETIGVASNDGVQQLKAGPGGAKLLQYRLGLSLFVCRKRVNLALKFEKSCHGWLFSFLTAVNLVILDG